MSLFIIDLLEDDALHSSNAGCVAGENFESLFKAVGGEGFVALAVVERIVGVEPIALGVDVQVGDL